MKKNDLKQIYYLNKEIKMWEEELERIQRQSLTKGKEITGMPFSGGTPDRVGDIVSHMCDIESMIRGKLSEIQLWRKKTIDYINGIDDGYIRQIYFLRHISCMKWEEIANEIGGSSEAIRQAYSRFLRKK